MLPAGLCSIRVDLFSSMKLHKDLSGSWSDGSVGIRLRRRRVHRPVEGLTWAEEKLGRVAVRTLVCRPSHLAPIRKHTLFARRARRGWNAAKLGQSRS